MESQPCDFTTPCLVVGGGPAGYGAALAAARNGCKVMLVERHGFLGGMGAAANLSCYINYRSGEEDLSEAAYRELIGQLRASGLSYPVRYAHTDYIDPEFTKVVMEKTLIGAGVTLLYHSLFERAARAADGGWLVEFVAKNARIRVRADYVIDATGDADVCASAGAAMTHGRKSDGRAQPMSMVTQLSGFDPGAWERAGEPIEAGRYAVKCDCFADLIARARAEGEWTIPRENIAMLWAAPGDPTSVTINGTRINGLSACDPLDVTRAEIEGRRQADELARFFKKYVPGFERSHLSRTGPQIGVRESRRITGRALLTEDDVRESRHPDDSITRCAYPIDVHSPDSASTQFESIPGKHSYGIPWGCLLPASLENMAAAGRCISATHEAAGSFRVMPTCMGLGEAAGSGVAIAAERGAVLSSVPAQAVRAMMDGNLRRREASESIINK
ncbi:FAD-dependent oxidoreductase [Ereboglobus luteus]|uniref:FAD-dependent oxidoreductase n=1 Tax=Ereboglobus luteus TaxID=1796921 RepID=A0A2U8E5C0_9BACT|nr:FAD-dependent oxidoreductase [Ereboglobus luteus]AWI09955.1 FAD-dependent oxidoreductase [Ereboglobus luteus]